MASPLTAADQAVLFASFGDSGTYTTAAGVATTGVYAIIDRGSGSIRDEAGQIVQEADQLTFLRSVLDPPAQGATWTDGTTTWTIGDVIDRDEVEIIVTARRS